jgi:class I fructose-bisphosphate aldolase
MSDAVQHILSWYESDNPGVKTNLARMLYHGKLGGTGKLVILPVDQGFEHGPDRCFVPNPPAYDPHYHFELAIEAGLSAFASPLGMLEAGAATFAGRIPLILKVNSANLLYPKEGPKTQAVTSTVRDALRLGCCAVGLTIYPGSLKSYDMFEVARDFVGAAKEVGLPTVIWSYPRGEELSKDGETAIDITTYATQMAALLGAHIIKVKLPTGFVEAADVADLYRKGNVPIGTLADRIRLVMKAALGGRRMVVFSGGAKADEAGLIEQAKAIRDGGGNGSIIGRNSFQRSKPDALELLGKLVDVYRS